MEKKYKYKAFISYRHLPVDSALAAAIHQMIETFKLPKDLQKERGKEAFRVFRDREELSAGDLSDSIEEALQESEFLIVVASKRTPLSVWCTKEVERFRKLHGDERIITVLIEGEPYESFSQPLKELRTKRMLEDGTTREAARELLAAELRPAEVKDPDFPGYEKLEKEDPKRLNRLIAEAKKLLKTEKYRIMASMLGLTLGDLKQRDKERRTKFMMQVSALLASLFLIFGVFMTRAYQKENIARREAIQSRASVLLKKSREFLKEGDKIKSLLVADEALKEVDDSMKQYQSLVASHRGILNDAIYSLGASLRTVINNGNHLSFFGVDPKGRWLATGYGNHQTGLFDLNSGELVKLLDGHKEMVKITTFSPDGKYLATSSFDDTAIIYDLDSMKEVSRIDLKGDAMMTSFNKQGNLLYLLGAGLQEMTFQVLDVATLERVGEAFTLPSNISRISIDEEGKTMLVTFDTFAADRSLVRYDIASGKVLKQYKDQQPEVRYEGARLSLDNKTFFVKSGQNLLRMDLETGEVLFSTEVLFLNMDHGFQESESGDIMLSDNSVVAFYSPQGEKKKHYIMPSGIVKNMLWHEDTKQLAIIQEQGKIALFQDGILTVHGLDFGGGIPEFMQFDPLGERLAVSSRSTKQIKLIDLKSQLLETIPAQIAAVSSDASHVLLFDGKKFLTHNNQTGEEKDANNEKIGFSGSYVFDHVQLAISSDGKLVGYHSYIVDENQKRIDALYVLNNETGEERTFQVPRGNYKIEFTPDSRLLVAAAPGFELVMIDLVENTQTSGLTVQGNLKKMVFSADSSLLSINYLEGKSVVVGMEHQNILRELPGEVLWLQATDKDQEIVGLYNNKPFIYSEGKLTEKTLDPDVDKVQVGFDDINLYDAASNRMLLIRNEPAMPIAFLLDFDDGRLIKTFQTSLNQYNAKGFLSDKGNKVTLDQAYFATSEDGSDKGTGKLDIYASSVVFKLLDYEELKAKAKEIFGERSFSQEERKDLGLE